MRILYASERPPYPFFLGGAARCAHEIMHQLVKNKSVECTAIGSTDFSNPPWSFPDTKDYKSLGILTVENKGSEKNINCGYPVRVIPDFSKGLSDIIDQYQPDVVWAQMEGAQLVIETAYKKGVHSLIFVHDAEFDVEELKKIVSMASGIVCSSVFLAKKVHKAIRQKAKVVYPCPKVDFNVQGDVNGYITMINPHRVKGLDTFLEVAKRKPEQQFLLVESWKLTKEALNNLNKQLEILPNVKFVRRVSDMRQIYKQTKVLLAPSIWEEGFGMVAIEAQSCGIPIIASARGGLPEAVGNGGILIDDYQNPELWVKDINNLINDREIYTDLAKLAHNHAHLELFSTNESARLFLNYCNTIIKKEVRQKKDTTIFRRLISLFKK